MPNSQNQKAPVRILHLEDSERDADLIQAILEQNKLNHLYQRVETEADFRAALASRNVDLVLADLSLPTFDGKTALSILQETSPSIPFLFVSGTIGEEAAIESIRLGATDYILKNRLSRLPLAVQRALSEAEERAERHKLEQQLLCIQRMEGFGLIAAGITHDIKNLLHPVKFAAHLIEEKYTDPKLLDLVRLIRDSADRGIEMIGQMMDLFRVSDRKPQRLDVPKIIRELADLIASAFPEIEVVTEVSPALPVLFGHPNEVYQALLNLVMNARDAMKGAGRLWISARAEQLEEDFFLPPEFPSPGAYIHLSVRDSGSGIPAEILPHLFEPLFTTKEPGTGTGLGLVSVTTILHNHHGFARAANAPEGGAVFHLYFPATSAEAAAALSQEDGEVPPALLTGSGQRIGLVTEEAALRAAFKDILSTCGYDVVTAEYGAEALGEFGAAQDDPQRLDLVILDKELSMVDGLETARALQSRHPIPIVLVTVDSGLKNDATLKKLGIRAVLQRPFDTAHLLEVVASVLEGE